MSKKSIFGSTYKQHDVEDSRHQEYQEPDNTVTQDHTMRSDSGLHSGQELHIGQWNSNCDQVSHIPGTGHLWVDRIGLNRV